nr:SDR family oxidoreductase [Rhizobium alvei]
MNFSLDGKSAFVSGASSGLGRYFAQTLAQSGAGVTIAARRRSALDETAATITRAGGSVSIVEMDVTDDQSVERAFAGSAGIFDIVVNNAGVTHDGPALRTTMDDWDRVIQTDLGGVFRVAKAAASRMKEAGNGGSLINIASILGIRVAGNVAAYAAAKAGVIQLTRSLALEWARFDIRVNALCPGYIETDLNREFFASEAGQALIRRIPQRRLGQVDDLRGALLLLASDASRFITGTEIVVDGGHLVSSL